jgi:5-methylcytosine-specific restriction protein A
MKGQVFTVAKLHYINGVVYEVAKQGTTDLQELARLSAQTTKSGKAKHPLVRVRTLARLAEGVGLIKIFNKNKVQITELGKQYAENRSKERWIISKEQQQILGKYIISDFYRTGTIYSIATLFELCKKGYTGDELSHQFAAEIGKSDAWKSEVTYRGFTKFGLSYISELGLLDIDEKDLLIEDISKEQRYQNDLNIIEPVQVPSGKIPRPKPKKYGGREKYSTNPRRAKNALDKANFICELGPSHLTFINKKSGKQYMEAHHLIPMSKQHSFEFDIDVPENILCICPTCHRKIHLAQDDIKKEILLEAFKDRKSVLPARGINLDIKMLFSMYSV